MGAGEYVLTFDLVGFNMDNQDAAGDNAFASVWSASGFEEVSPES